MGMHTVEPVLYSIIINVNDHPHSLLSGEKLVVHPKDRLKIIKISTNVPFNIGIRLYCKMFDAQSLLYDEYKVVDLLGEQTAFSNPTLTVQIKYYNQEAGHVTFIVRPFVGDWLEKASRIIDRKKRIAVLEEALKKVPGSGEIQERLLKEYLEAGFLKKAADILEKKVAKAPSKSTLAQLLDIYNKVGDTKGIIFTLQRLIELDPADKESRYALARLLEKKGRISKAVAQYKALVKLASPQEKFDLYVQLGYLSAKAGKVREAIQYYEKASELHKRDENLYYNLSYLYDKLGNKKKADYYLEKAVRLKSSDIEGRMKLAERWIQQGKYKKAGKVLSEVLKRRPRHLNALVLMAQVAEKTGNKPLLKDTYRKILKLQPKNATVLYNLGALEYEDGRLQAASGYLEKYVAMRPKDKPAHALLLDIYKQRNKIDKALKEAERLIELGTRDQDIYAFIFKTLKAKGDFKRLESVMEAAVRRDPRNTQLRKYLLFAYLQNQKESLAMAEMEKILKLEPKNVELWMHLARLKEKNKKYGEAMAAYKKVIELEPDNDQAADAYLKLRLQGFEEKRTQ